MELHFYGLLFLPGGTLIILIFWGVFWKSGKVYEPLLRITFLNVYTTMYHIIEEINYIKKPLSKQ